MKDKSKGVTWNSFWRLGEEKESHKTASEVWERILKMLPASALKHVAPLPEIEVQAALPKVQLCHAVSMNDDGGRRKFRHGRRWLLRLGENRVLYMCFYVLYMVYIYVLYKF